MTGALVGSTHVTNMPRGNSKTDPWVNVDYTTALSAGQTYSFVVTMNNPANFDAGYVKYVRDCNNDEQINLCCTPWTENKSGAALQPVPGPGGLFSNYGVSYQSVAASNTQMQAYASYLDATNPNFATLHATFEAKSYGTGANPSGSGAAVNGVGPNSVIWSGNNTQASIFWSGFPFQQDVWYGFTTTVIARDDQRRDLELFAEQCEPVTVYYRVQSMGGTRSMIAGRPGRGGAAQQFILQKSNGKRVTSATPLKTGAVKGRPNPVMEKGLPSKSKRRKIFQRR